METRDIYWDRWGGRILSWMEIFANRRGVIAASASASLIQSKYCPLPEPPSSTRWRMVAMPPSDMQLFLDSFSIGLNHFILACFCGYTLKAFLFWILHFRGGEEEKRQGCKFQDKAHRTFDPINIFSPVLLLKPTEFTRRVSMQNKHYLITYVPLVCSMRHIEEFQLVPILYII